MKPIAALLISVLTLASVPVVAQTGQMPDATPEVEPSMPGMGMENAPPAVSMPDQQTSTRQDVAVPKRFHVRKAKKAPPPNQLKIAERAGYKKVSDLVSFPPFFPGLGIVTVKPDTLPVGPFRTFTRKGKLVATVYMLPLKDMNDQKRWDYVTGLPAAADHATFYFHPGHAGVPVPHYHLVIWHVSRKNEALVAK